MTKMDYFCFTKAQLRLLAMALSKLHDNSLRPTVCGCYGSTNTAAWSYSIVTDVTHDMLCFKSRKHVLVESQLLSKEVPSFLE